MKNFNSQNSQNTASSYSQVTSLLPNKLQEEIVGDESETVVLGKRVGCGGSKNIYDIGNGYVVSLPNVEPELWKRMVGEEVFMANKLRDIGLSTQEYKAVIINTKKYTGLVLKMPSFSELV